MENKFRKEPMVSVVTPVYNTGLYLTECIESVISQKYTNWEYIIADNASTDTSGEIGQYYAKKDSRIRYLRFDELLPQVPNYNRALSQISSYSKYVKVLEADNWLYPECLEKMVALAESDPSIGVVSSYNVTEDRVRMTGLPLANSVVNGKELARMQLGSNTYVFGAPTTVMIRADLVHSTVPYYNENLLIAEDQSACFDALRRNNFGFVHQILSFVRTANESILSKIRSFDPQALDRVVLFHRHGRDFFSPSEYEQIKNEIAKRYYSVLAQAILRREDNRYWEFHRSGLRSEGLCIDHSKLALATGREVLSRLFNPLPYLR